MEPTWNILQAMQYCPYKAWQLSQQPESINKLTFPGTKLTASNRLALSAYALASDKETNQTVNLLQINMDNGLKPQIIRLKTSAKAEKLLFDTKTIISNSNPPPFYKNKHCTECQFWESCQIRLREKDCISLLGNISHITIGKYHKKGIFSITQLSHLFRPRRRSRRKPAIAGNYMWELKALALREQKTYVMYMPEPNDLENAIYIDFEGIPEENFIYLIGGFIKKENAPDEVFSFWADSKNDEKKIFRELFKLLGTNSLSKIYHYGSYETKSLKAAVTKHGNHLKQDFAKLQKRMINLLSYLRSYIYPPTYSNGLKELGNFLGFQWTENADGLQSLIWRSDWQESGNVELKEKLIRYNLEDCRALELVNQWIQELILNSEQENVSLVETMKRQSPFKFQSNKDFGEDYDIISKAAYFDYQQKKIYWRNKKAPPPIIYSREAQIPIGTGKGVSAWNPKKVNEIMIAEPLKYCPGCGSTKVYQLRKTIKGYKQTDIKFTALGVKQHVTEYRSTQAKCGKCRMKYNNGIIRRKHYGDNLFAWVINVYVNYHISHEMISKMVMDLFGIFIDKQYLIDRKDNWWMKWKPEVNYTWEIIYNSPVIHIDETTVKLFKDTGYVWVFATPHTVFYHFTYNRESDFLKEWLKGYKGIIVTDFYAGYETLKIKRQKCLIHLIRDLNDDLHKNPFDGEYKSLMENFSKLLIGIITTVDKYGLKTKHFQKHIKETETFYKKYLLSEHKSELSIKYAKRLKKHWEELWLFLQHDDVPWNNNNAEAAVKAFAMYRRGVNGQIRERGLRPFLEMLSLAQTCRYRNISYLDFLTNKVGIWENIPAELLPKYLPFPQARLFAQRLGFYRKREWTEWIHSGKRPAYVPSFPDATYKNKGWVNWQDWLGFKYLSFEKARAYIRRLGLKNRNEYWTWQRSGKRPRTIPPAPQDTYKYTGWVDLGDWLGTGNKGQQRKQKMTYEQAKKYVQSVGIKTQLEFFAWRKTSERPDTLPTCPNRAYVEFKTWGEFFGTGRIANQDMKYRSYDDAKTFLKPLRITSQKHFIQLYEVGIIPKDIPKKPYSYYSKHNFWVSFPDFVGKEDTINPFKK